MLLKKLSAHFRLARHDKPIGALLLYTPCVWGVLLGQPQFDAQTALFYSGVFGVGSFAMRSAGCVVNDMWDRDIDKKVERTLSRPLASGELSMTEAWLNLGFHCSIGLCVLTQLSWTTIATSFSIIPIAFLYPLAKRYFSYPQLILGLAFNWGVIVGATQMSILSLPIAIAYLAGITNTIIYDTIYAHQDKQFDKKLGLYSTAYTLPRQTPLYLTWAFSGLIAAASYTSGYNPICYPLIAAMQFSMFNQIKSTDLDSPESCSQFFRNFKWYQVYIGLVFGVGSYFK